MNQSALDGLIAEMKKSDLDLNHLVIQELFVTLDLDEDLSIFGEFLRSFGSEGIERFESALRKHTLDSLKHAVQAGTITDFPNSSRPHDLHMLGCPLCGKDHAISEHRTEG